MDWRDVLEARLGDALAPEVERWTFLILLERPDRGRWATWRWRQRWRKAEYDAFVEGGAYGSLRWCVLKKANEAAGVWG